MARARLYSGDSHQNPWEELEAVLEASIQNNPHWKSEMAAKDEKLAIMEQKLAETEAKLAKLDKSNKKAEATA